MTYNSAERFTIYPYLNCAERGHCYVDFFYFVNFSIVLSKKGKEQSESATEEAPLASSVGESRKLQ